MLSRLGFTLIELLVVIAIIAILSVVVLLTLNPAQLLMQSRDSDRVSDMSTLNSALGIYSAQGGLSLGSSNIVYVSIPDPSATSTAGDQCQGLGLISLPAGYSYFCAASSTYRSTNGTGWVPVNFASMAAGSPLSILPIDPAQSSSSRLYYTYTTNGSQYELTSNMESQKYQLGGSNDVIGNDGGTLASVYEKGSKLGLEPLDYGDTGLVGLWTMNEGTGTIAYDYSGNNATGSWSGTQIGNNGTYYSTNAKIGPYSGDFDGSTDAIQTSNDNALAINSGSSWSLSFWFNPSSSSGSSLTFMVLNGVVVINRFGVIWQGTASSLKIYNGNYFTSSQSSFTVGAWYFATEVQNGNTLNLYINGALDSSNASSYTTTGAASPLGVGQYSGHYFSGLVDDVRVYNRAFTAAQVAAMYAGGK